MTPIQVQDYAQMHRMRDGEKLKQQEKSNNGSGIYLLLIGLSPRIRIEYRKKSTIHKNDICWSRACAVDNQ